MLNLLRRHDSLAFKVGGVDFESPLAQIFDLEVDSFDEFVHMMDLLDGGELVAIDLVSRGYFAGGDHVLEDGVVSAGQFDGLDILLAQAVSLQQMLLRAVLLDLPHPLFFRWVVARVDDAVVLPDHSLLSGRLLGCSCCPRRLSRCRCAGA